MQYAAPVVDEMEKVSVFEHRLFRDSTINIQGIYVKDLSRLNRDLSRTIIIDNSPESYLLQPENAIPIRPFFGDKGDRELLDILHFLNGSVHLRQCVDVDRYCGP